ncbi:hypothetical protein [Myxococcus stipitatus]|uniref:WD40 repeat domain-containing protein n=1 Tax=Myxococcus stipitatus TaxID=83455 RepID=UPI0030CB98E8
MSLERHGNERLRWWRWSGAATMETQASEVIIPQGLAARPIPAVGGIAVTDERGRLSLFALDDGRLLRQSELPRRETWALAANNHGTLLAMHDLMSGVLLWDAVAWTSLGRLEGPQTEVAGFAFSPDGRLLAVACLKGRVVIWEVPSGRCVHVHEERDTWFTNVAFHPSGTELVATTTSERIQRFRVGDWNLTGTLSGPPAGSSYAAYSPEGNWFAATKGGFCVYETRTNTCLLHHDVDNDFYYSNAVFSPDGTAVAWGEPDGTVSLWGPTPVE